MLLLVIVVLLLLSLLLFVCVCVCVCVSARAHTHARERESVCVREWVFCFDFVVVVVVYLLAFLFHFINKIVNESHHSAGTQSHYHQCIVKRVCIYYECFKLTFKCYLLPGLLLILEQEDQICTLFPVAVPAWHRHTYSHLCCFVILIIFVFHSTKEDVVFPLLYNTSFNVSYFYYYTVECKYKWAAWNQTEE